MAFLCLIVVSPTIAAQETSHVRFAHYVNKGPQVNIFVSDQVFTDEDKKPYGLNALDLSRAYMDVSAGTPQTFTVVEADKTVDAALFKPEAFTLEADHNYALIIMGNLVSKDLHFKLLDETAALAAHDTKASAVTFVINNLHGLPAVDFYFGGKLLINKLAYGDHVVILDPQGTIGSQFTVHGDPKAVLFDLPDAIPGPAETIAFFGIVGNYPGTIWEDYTLPYAGNYIGKPFVRDGGSIAVGDVIKMSLNEPGLRYHYKLDLAKDTVLDIDLKGGGRESGADSIIRIYDANDNLVAQNDDLDRNLGLDAGLRSLKLGKGSYIIEAASAFDTFLGDYTLSVSASK